MEIKKGDKVKVSKDAPRVYLSSVNNLFKYHVCKVEETDGDSAKIRYTDIGIDRWLAIPIKYLIKDDAEAKEPKFKKGDLVRIGETINPQLHGRVGAISRIDGDGYKISFPNGYFTYVSEEDLSLVEPTKQADANEEMQEEYARFMSGRTPCTLADKIERKHIQHRMRVLSQDDFLKDFDPMEHKVKPMSRYIPKIMFNTEFWVKYEADLAKEIAVKAVNRLDNPQDVAPYAVDIAKDIVKRLKQTK